MYQEVCMYNKSKLFEKSCIIPVYSRVYKKSLKSLLMDQSYYKICSRKIGQNYTLLEKKKNTKKIL